MEALRAGRTIPQTEATISLSDGGQKLVMVAGHPIDTASAHCMLFTFVDLDQRKQAEARMRQSEERITKAFDLSPLPATVSTLDDYRFQDANAAFLAVVGYTQEEIIGHGPAEFEIWEDRKEYRRHLQTLRQHGSLSNQDIRVRTKDGQLLGRLMSAQTCSANGNIWVLSVLRDVTERKRTKAEQASALESVMKDTSWFSRAVIEKLTLIRHLGAAVNPSTEVDDLSISLSV